MQKINVNKNSLAVMNLNYRSLCKNINYIEIFFMNLNQTPDKCLFIETWLSQILIPPRIEGFVDFH